MNESIDLIKINFDQENVLFLNICLAFIMFAISLEIKKEDFEGLFRQPKPALVGIFSQLVLMPLLTIGLVHVFNPPPSIALGMVAISACPGGNNSNYITHLAKGKTALAITTTSISVIVCIVSMPFLIWVGTKAIPNIGHLEKPVSIDVTEMVKIVGLLILLPLVIGMYLNHNYPSITAKIHKPAKLISLGLFVSLIVGGVVANINNIIQYVGNVFFIVLVLNGVALLTGYWFSKLNRLTESECRAISFETGIHNVTLALIIIFNFFDGLGGMALIAAWYGIWDLFMGMSLALWWSKSTPKD